VYDAQSQALRPLTGIPGAAYFAAPLATPLAIGSAAFSLRQNIAVVNNGTWNALMLSPSGVTGTVNLPGSLPANARVELSETGSAAAFYDATNSALTVITGITAGAPAANGVSLDSLPGAITKFAVGDDGSLLLASAMSGGGEGLFWAGQDGSLLQLATMQSTASILLWNAGANALLTDRGASQIWQIQSPGNQAAITLLASAADGVAGPVGAALSSDGSQLWIANEGNQNVLGINLATRATLSLPCGFHLATLLPMTDGTSFRLNHAGKGPMWMLDTSPTSGPRIVFVPAMITEVSQ
jgi:DNA-binding beta-propeller fold protein YncE